MTADRLNILVEGSTDRTFFQHVLVPLARRRYARVEFAEIANIEPYKVDRLIRGFVQNREDYILVRDLDKFPCASRRVAKLAQKLPHLDPRRVQIVIQEIESWIYAGADRATCSRLGLEHGRLAHGTNALVKEGCVGIKNPDCELTDLELHLELCNAFDLSLGTARNKSLARFLRRFLPWAVAARSPAK